VIAPNAQRGSVEAEVGGASCVDSGGGCTLHAKSREKQKVRRTDVRVDVLVVCPLLGFRRWREYRFRELLGLNQSLW
jgi:hypothetical protein